MNLVQGREISNLHLAVRDRMLKDDCGLTSSREDMDLMSKMAAGEIDRDASAGAQVHDRGEAA
jgi:hypothetical protein